MSLHPPEPARASDGRTKVADHVCPHRRRRAQAVTAAGAVWAPLGFDLEDSIAASALPVAITSGVSSTLSVVGLPGDAAGTVTFTDAAVGVLCTATLPATSCLTSPSLGGGHYLITASYSGDAFYQPATATAKLTVDYPAGASTEVTLNSTRLVTGPGNRTITVRVYCHAGPCSGVLELTDAVTAGHGARLVASAPLVAGANAAALVIARGAYQLASEANGIVVLRITAAGRRRLARVTLSAPLHGRVIATVSGGITTITKVTVR